MIQINLIPDVKREYLRTRSQRNFVVFVSMVVSAGAIGLAVVLGVFFGGQLIAENILNGNIKDEGVKLTSVKDLNKIVTIQQQLIEINKQHDQKSTDSRLFDVMSTITPPAPNDIKISVLKLDPAEKRITIEGVAPNGYIALEVFKKTILNTSIQLEGDQATDGDKILLAYDAKIDDGDTSFGEDSEGRRVLRFAFSFVYSPELFSLTSGSFKLETPAGRVDVTDSKQGVPDDLFSRQTTEGDE